MTEKRHYGWRSQDKDLQRVIHRRLKAHDLSNPYCVIACDQKVLRTISLLPMYAVDDVKMTDCCELLTYHADDVTCPKCEQLGFGRQLPEIPE